MRVKEKKTVDIYTTSSCNNTNANNNGYYIVELRYKNASKYIRKYLNHMTPNRLIIIGLTDAIKLLKEPCYIKAYLPCKIGLSKIRNKQGEFKESKNCSNKKYLDELSQVLVAGGYMIEENITTMHVNRLRTEAKKEIKFGEDF